MPLAQLDRLPRAETDRYLCLAIGAAGDGGERRLCLGGPRRTHRTVGLQLIGAGGETVRERTASARVKRPAPRKLTLALLPEAVGLTPRRYRWRLLEGLGGCRPPGGASCQRSLPADGTRTFRLRPVRPVGCTGGGAGEVFNGPRGRKVVALTFDDGPSAYTPRFLAVLRQKRVHATFFQIGQEIGGRSETMRQVLADGNEIGNHTTHHGFYPGYEDLTTTSALIRSATRFQPCLFRPPGGAVNSAVVAAAAGAGMRTVLWDVDPADWTNPGSAAVYSRVVGAVQPGSIVIMHDGGGDRSGTLAALPSIIDTLRRRGYRFATVSRLLGQHLIYRPYG